MPMPIFNLDFANACSLKCLYLRKDANNDYVCKRTNETLVIREVDGYHQDVLSRTMDCIKTDGNVFRDSDLQGNKQIIKRMEKDMSRTNKVDVNKEHYYWVFELHIPLRICIPRFISKYIVEAYSQVEKKAKVH